MSFIVKWFIGIRNKQRNFLSPQKRSEEKTHHAYLNQKYPQKRRRKNLDRKTKVRGVLRYRQKMNRIGLKIKVNCYFF